MACNYDEGANMDDGSCAQFDCNNQCDGNWGYSSDDLSSTGDYVFSITREEGTMNWDAAIVVKY